MLAERSDATHREPWSSASPIGCGSPSTVVVSLLVRASTRASASAQPPPADQTAVASDTRNAQGEYGTFTVPVTAFVAGSTRTSALLLGTATQTASSRAVIDMCSAQQAARGPTRIVATTRFVAGSMRDTPGPPMSATQTASRDTASPAGCRPAAMVAVTVFVDGSMRDTRSLPTVWETQTAPAPAATASPGPMSSTRASIVFVCGSIRKSVDVVSFTTQRAPSPAASAPPPGGTAIVATTFPPRGSALTAASSGSAPETTTVRDGASEGDESMRVTVFDAKLLTQTEVPPGTIANVAPSTDGATRIDAPTFPPERASIRDTVPSSASVTNTEPPAAASQDGVPPTWVDVPMARSVRGSRCAISPVSRSAYQTLPAATTIPTGKPPTSTRVTARVSGSIRSSSPSSAAVTHTYPSPTATSRVRPDDSRSGGAVGASVTGSRRRSTPGLTSSAQR